MAKSSLKTREKFAALGFVAPLFIGFALFTAVPLVVAVIYSLVDYMPLQGKISPVSFNVYISLFKNQLTMLGFGQAILNTLIIMLSIPVNLLLGLLFSALISQKSFRGGTFFRVVYYLPAVTGTVAITLVWKLMFNETQGIINVALKAMGASFMTLFTGENNPARNIYEAAGFTVVRTWADMRKTLYNGSFNN